MASRIVKEANAPYIVNPDDEAIGRDTIVIRRNGEPVAVVLPYADYAKLVEHEHEQSVAPAAPSTAFERERAAFHRILPELLNSHRGEWVAIVEEQAVEFGPDFSSVIRRVRERFGQRPVYVQEILEKPRVYKIESPLVIRR